MSALLPLDEAQARLLAMIEPLAIETLPVDETLGRHLAEPLLSRRTQPAADLSAMDGYAVGPDDLTGPWRVVGESAAGHPYTGSLKAGEAVRISTGALMPDGADAVLLQENAARDGERLTLANADGPTPRHVRRAGFDFREGVMLLPANARIGAAQLSLAISGGHSQLPVRRLPKVAIIDSGDELATDATNLAVHQIPASNGAMLAAMCRPHATQCDRIGPVADRLEALVDAFAKAGDADVIVTSGGASVGDHDLIRPALEQWGATIDFWKVAIRPGKPLLVARKGSQIVLGLPGNPVSSYVTAFLFLLPLLRRMAGDGDPLPRELSLPLSDSLPQTGPRTEFVRALLDGNCLLPLSERDSSAQHALALAQALIRRDAGAPAAATGDIVTGYLLQNGGIA